MDAVKPNHDITSRLVVNGPKTYKVPPARVIMVARKKTQGGGLFLAEEVETEVSHLDENVA
ncbi:MAG: hypothetical protein Q9214_000631 [Letrouitia sp. 1 TL-2023]